MTAPRRRLAVVLCSVAVVGLLAAMKVPPAAAQTIDCAQSSAALIHDCETLLGLKDTLDPDDVLNWAGNLVIGLWDGVASYDSLGVTSLALHNRGLTGAIPVALRSLCSLIRLSIQDNQLSESIPEAFGHLTNLKELLLDKNRLSGEIPDFGAMGSLEKLDLSCNQ